jgi:sugar phosphate isomerase/epimerase
MIWVYDELASVYREFCDQAADVGVTMSIEVHQNSPVDNSWSAKLIHQKVGRKNFGVNPDIGNVVWNYDIPEEEYDAFIKATAPISVYWHCKNLHRIYHPENQRTVYIRVPLQDGEVDYRFAISAMADAGYSGYMAIEGAWSGDQWHADQRSLEYAKAIWAEVEKPAAKRKAKSA